MVTLPSTDTGRNSGVSCTAWFKNVSRARCFTSKSVPLKLLYLRQTSDGWVSGSEGSHAHLPQMQLVANSSKRLRL